MNLTFNIYCDESCHLEHDHKKVMTLGALWCPLETLKDVHERIQGYKTRHGLTEAFEVKWTKVSPAKVRFYRDLVEYFFANSELHFRALIIPDKDMLDHDKFGQDHDTWYYKMYFDLLKVILKPQEKYRIYIDIKDTRGGSKIAKLHEVLLNDTYDFSRDIIERVQIVHSHEIPLMQMADLLLGAVSAANRCETVSPAKKSLVELIKERSGYCLTKTTLLREEKFNIFRWQAKEA